MKLFILQALLLGTIFQPGRIYATAEDTLEDEGASQERAVIVMSRAGMTRAGCLMWGSQVDTMLDTSRGDAFLKSLMVYRALLCCVDRPRGLDSTRPELAR